MNYLFAFLNSFSQVFFLENKIFGLLIILGILIFQTRLGIFSVIGVLTSLIFASLIGIDKSLIYAGIIGFNASLIGIVCAMFLPKNPTAFLATLIFSIVAVLIQTIGLKYKFPVFTAPFVIMAFVVYFIKPMLINLGDKILSLFAK